MIRQLLLATDFDHGLWHVFVLYVGAQSAILAVLIGGTVIPPEEAP